MEKLRDICLSAALAAILLALVSAKAGTVTSVGLSAPASDFIVSGSPVTASGTLGLNWNFAPTSADAPNTIVKRDAAGGFNSGPILASDPNNVAIWGESFGQSAGADGVHGVAHGPASGVAGINDDPNGVGVWGQAPGWSFYSTGNVHQDRGGSGWVKAMIFYSGFNGGRIVTCFNSTLQGPAATTPPCGFSAAKGSTGDYLIDFGFEVDDRFFSLTQLFRTVPGIVCTSFTGGDCYNIFSLTPNMAQVVFSDLQGNLSDNKFFLVVY